MSRTSGSSAKDAARLISSAKASNGGLLILTGAGMSVESGVPVFRGRNGSMSSDFLRFLGAYNEARRGAGLVEADDWFSFSVPEMFRTETMAEAWAYWGWRMTRALVEPAGDYDALMRLVEYFGSPEKSFVRTSNCDMLHVRAGMPADRVEEIHGSLGRLQCAGNGGRPCSSALTPVDEALLGRLQEAEAAGTVEIPMCPKNCGACLRPNVMIFGDWNFVDSHLNDQADNFGRFVSRHGRGGGGGLALGLGGGESQTGRGGGGKRGRGKRATTGKRATCKRATGAGRGAGGAPEMNWVVLEIGGGVVVPSIRTSAEGLGAVGHGLVRVNPSSAECESMEMGNGKGPAGLEYVPVCARSSDALHAILRELGKGDAGDAGGSEGSESKT